MGLVVCFLGACLAIHFAAFEKQDRVPFDRCFGTLATCQSAPCNSQVLHRCCVYTAHTRARHTSCPFCRSGSRTRSPRKTRNCGTPAASLSCGNYRYSEPCPKSLTSHTTTKTNGSDGALLPLRRWLFAFALDILGRGLFLLRRRLTAFLALVGILGRLWVYFGLVGLI